MIDVHEDGGAPRVRHEGGILDQHLPYEDLCDLLAKFKEWLVHNPSEIVILLMEVTNDVKPEWIRDTFAGAGPVVRQFVDYDLSGLLYVHQSGAWPSIAQLVGTNRKRVVVFRETDGDKGRITDDDGNKVSGLEFYHNMWEHWLETPYKSAGGLGKNYWPGLQANTYVLSPAARGNPATASFFNVNHFVDSETYAAGSAGAAEGINQHDYLTARALIAWKMQGRRPTVSVDFFKSLLNPGAKGYYDTLKTAEYLNTLPAISGSFQTPGGDRFDHEISWDGVGQLRFSEHLGPQYLDWTIDDLAVTIGVPKSRLGTYCFPKNTSGAQSMTLTPSCSGYTFQPPSVTWNGQSNFTHSFVVRPVYAGKNDLQQAGFLDTPLWIHPSQSSATSWEVENDSKNAGTPVQLWSRRVTQNRWTIRYFDTQNGHDRFSLHNADLDRYVSVIYPWTADPRPPLAGYPVTSHPRNQWPNTQNFYVLELPDDVWAIVSGDAPDYAIVSEGGNTGDSTKLVLGARGSQLPANACWKFAR